MTHDARQDESGEEEDAGSDHPWDEGKDLVGHYRHGRQHFIETEWLERRNKSDEPDEPVGKAPKLGPDRIHARLRMALEDRHPVDQLSHRPLHRLGDEMGGDEDQDREDHPRSPLDQLVAPIGCRRVRFVHALRLP